MNKEKEEKLAEISARITSVIDYLGETPNSFATKLGYLRAQTVYDIQKMKSAPSYDFFQRFSNAEFSALIDINWLLTGNGQMLKQTVRNQYDSTLGTKNALIFSDKDRQNTDINQAETSYIYKMYQEEREEKRRMLKEKDSKIDHLQSELLAMAEELATLKAKHPESSTDHQKVLDHAKSASTKKPSSPNADNATSAPAP